MKYLWMVLKTNVCIAKPKDIFLFFSSQLAGNIESRQKQENHTEEGS